MAPTATERAEARRKAILARGSDRLAKLTTSARGDEPAFIHDERPPPGRPANLSAFMGEDSSILPPKPALSTTSTATAARTPSFSRVPSTAASSTVGPSSSIGDDDPSAWNQTQQDHFMRALMGAGLAGAGVGVPGVTTPRIDNGTGSTPPAIDPSSQQDPMMQLMSSLMGAQGGAGGPGASPFGPPGAASPFGGPGMNMGMAPPPVKQKTLVQKILPVVHVLATFALMVYFILFVEPKAHGEDAGGPWARWNELRKEPGKWGWSLKTVPFFTAFITLEILLQSIRITTGLDSAQLPGLLNMALPMLPPPIPSVVRNGLRYAQIFTVMLDDISAVIVALGLVIWASGYISA